MITDTIISALTNLFALFCSKGDVDEKMSEKMLNEYLGRHFGIRNREEYITLFKEVRELYSEMPNLNTDDIVDNICTSLKSEILHEEGIMVLLRLMEFCCRNSKSFSPDDPIFVRSAKNLGISKETTKDLADFVQGTQTTKVKLTVFDAFKAPLKTLWLKKQNLMLFCYDGEDSARVVYSDVPIIKGMFRVFDTSGVLRNHSGKPIYYSSVMALYEKPDEKKQIEFCGRNIDYHFPNTTNGIHNFSFDMHNGELIAIMGGSGTGKTTLVSILNGNIKPQSGTITINGHSIDEPEAKALIGFVPQDDLLIEELTVFENLYYTAKLCFEGMSEIELEKRVLKTLKDLGLEQVKDLTVGSPIKKFISGGQRKRLNIALELIREPAVLFLDEPTSGLSSTDTEKVILLLKEQTLHGRLVVTNIHQPSSDVYKLFDRLWMLDKGGYPVFDGNPIEAVTYFKTAANYADADTSTCPTCGNVNPEIILNIIDEKSINSRGEETEERKMTPERWHQMYLEKMPEMKEPQQSDIPETKQKKPGLLKQWIIFLTRNIKTKITNLQYLTITLFEAPLLALVCAILTHYTPPEGEYSILENKNLVSYIFMAVIVATFIGMSGSAEEIIKDRALLKREKFLNLSYHSYIWSKIAIMVFVSTIQMLLFVIVGDYVMGISGLFLEWWGILSATAILSGLVGLLLSQTLNSVVAIYITIPILLIPQILLCGLVVKFSDLTPMSTTGNVPVIGNIIPTRWSYEALAVATYAHNKYEEPLFELDKEKYETQYYRRGVIYELQSALESIRVDKERGATPNPEDEEVLREELPFVAQICGMEPYKGDYDYDSTYRFLEKADSIMLSKGNEATLAADRKMQQLARTMSREEMTQFKRDNFNLQLEAQLAGHDAKTICEVVMGHIVPRAGFVYLTPRTCYGNAPFYSSVKRIGTLTIPTLWFNLAVILLMCVVLTVTLLIDIPDKIRKYK